MGDLIIWLVDNPGAKWGNLLVLLAELGLDVLGDIISDWIREKRGK